ncbi:MAG TPA: ATP-binding protein [Polyangiaceae bacterium]|nr:ATP-binding protein [Polyangiaceae bacterium]
MGDTPNLADALRKIAEAKSDVDRLAQDIGRALSALERLVGATESRYRALVEQLPGVVYYRALDAPGIPSFVSPQVQELLGFSPEEVLRDPNFWRDRVHPDDRDRIVAEQSQFEPTQFRVPVYGEYRMLRKNGDVVWVKNYALAVRDECERARFVLGILIDVTQSKRLEDERRELERQLQQAQRMEAIGRLAGGVAHDFNNSLTVVLSYGALALEMLTPDDPVHADVSEIVRAAERAHATTQQLLAVSRRQILRPTEVDLGNIVNAMAPMLQRLLGEDIELVLETQSGSVKIDVAQIENVILNLAANARDAMRTGGRLTLRTERVALESAHAGTTPGRYVLLSVADTGHGMDRATRECIFEPFFSNKEPGKGTGLGLASVYGIVEQSAGRIRVSSQPGQGTTFKIYLPEVETSAVAPAAAPPERDDVPRGSETVLLVEDDDIVRRVTGIMLTKLGYEVLEASGMDHAIDRSNRHEGPIDVLLTDVVMPQGSGHLLAEKLTAIRKDMKVIYMSGYAPDTLAEHGLVAERVVILEKPFSGPGLARAIRRVLDGRP